MNSYFCVLPFFGYEFGNLTGPYVEKHCCLLPRDYSIDEVRQSILQGERSAQCQACWDLEDAGLTSDRQLKNAALDFYLDRDIDFIEQDVRAGEYHTNIVKLTTSNTCNSTCTCHYGSN